MSAGEEVVELFSSSASGMATPWKTSSSLKVRYHFTSSLSSNTLFTNKQGSPPVGRSFCSAQYWRALAYATTFSLGTSLMSQLAKMESASSINICQQRHGRAGRAWRVALPASSSCSHHGSPTDTLTCLASFLVLSSPGTVDSSIHQLGVLHLSAFHGTHSAKSRTAGSGGSSCPHHPMFLVTPAGRRPLLALTLAVPPNQSLHLWTLLCLMASQGRQIG